MRRVAIIGSAMALLSWAASGHAEEETPRRPSETAPDGFVWSVAGVGMATGGEVVRGVEMYPGGVGLDARLGYYFTPSFGIVGGARGGVGGAPSDCSGCSSWFLRLPLLAQYSLGDRSRGLYFSAGAALAPRHVVTSDAGTMTASSIADAELGIGYRLASLSDASQARPWSLDAWGAVDFGWMTSARATQGGVTVEGDIPTGDRRVHHAFLVSVGVSFSP